VAHAFAARRLTTLHRLKEAAPYLRTCTHTRRQLKLESPSLILRNIPTLRPRPRPGRHRNPARRKCDRGAWFGVPTLNWNTPTPYSALRIFSPRPCPCFASAYSLRYGASFLSKPNPWIRSAPLLNRSAGCCSGPRPTGAQFADSRKSFRPVQVDEGSILVFQN
jgi:hypothetical protein